MALAAFCTAAYAQEDGKKTAKDRLSEIENMTVDAKKHKSISSDNDLFEANVLSHLRFGWHRVDDAAFKSKFGPSREIQLNMLELSVNPLKWLSLNIGADLKWERFTAKADIFTINNKGELVLGPNLPLYDHNTLRTRSITLPAVIDIHFEDYFGIKAGCEYSFPVEASTLSFSTVENGKAKTSSTIMTTGGKPDKNTLNWYGEVNFGGLVGVYFKYSPETPVPGSVSSKTLGLTINF